MAEFLLKASYSQGTIRSNDEKSLRTKEQIYKYALPISSILFEVLLVIRMYVSWKQLLAGNRDKSCLSRPRLTPLSTVIRFCD